MPYATLGHVSSPPLPPICRSDRYPEKQACYAALCCPAHQRANECPRALDAAASYRYPGTLYTASLRRCHVLFYSPPSSSPSEFRAPALAPVIGFPWLLKATEAHPQRDEGVQHSGVIVHHLHCMRTLSLTHTHTHSIHDIGQTYRTCCRTTRRVGRR